MASFNVPIDAKTAVFPLEFFNGQGTQVSGAGCTNAAVALGDPALGSATLASDLSGITLVPGTTIGTTNTMTFTATGPDGTALSAVATIVLVADTTPKTVTIGTPTFT